MIDTLRASLLRESPPVGVLRQDDGAYFAAGGLGGSGLSPALRSGRHWLQAQTAERVESAAMRLGTAVHCLVLEPQRWLERYAPPFSVGRVDASLTLYETGREVEDRLRALKADGHAVKVTGSNADKMDALRAVEPTATYVSDLAADYYREQAGRIILPAEDEDRVRGCAAAVRDWHVAWVEAGNRPLLGGLAEQSIAWVDPETGIYCRGKIDAVSPDEAAWVDLKTTSDAGPAFARYCSTGGYPEQAAHYLDGYRVLTESDTHPRWAWLVVETDPPHGVQLYWASDDLLARAFRRRRLALERILDVLTRPDAEVYPVEAKTIELTAWERREEEGLT